MSDGLSVQQRESIQRVFLQYSCIEQALLYGSRAIGRYRAGSDIDLTLVGDIDLTLLNQISLSLDDLLLPYEIDLSVFEQIENLDLREYIKRVGIVFYKQ